MADLRDSRDYTVPIYSARYRLIVETRKSRTCTSEYRKEQSGTAGKHNATASATLDNASATHDAKRMAFDEAIAATIAERIATGEPLEAICRELPGAPTSRTVYRWIESSPELLSDITRARAAGHDAIAWRAREIARGKVDAGSTGDVARDKLIVETDLKLLAKWDKRYSDTQKVELTGANGSDLFAGMSKHELQAELVRRMSNPELLRALQAAGVTVAALPAPSAKADKG